MRRSLFKFISQKINALCALIRTLAKKIYSKKSICIGGSAGKALEPAQSIPRKEPLSGVGIILALKYIFKIVNASEYEKGAGIIISDVNSIREMNTFLSLVCSAFRYITVYTENAESANKLADYVYDRFGLPIMVMTADEAPRCRYPVIIDFISGKVRYGRDLCIDGIFYDANDSLLGISIGSRIVKADYVG